MSASTSGKAVFDALAGAMDKAGKIPGMKSKIDYQTSKDTGPLTK